LKVTSTLSYKSNLYKDYKRVCCCSLSLLKAIFGDLVGDTSAASVT